MKTCTRCGQTCPVESFPWRNRREGKRKGYCKDCQNKDSRKHYAANRGRYVHKAREAKWKVREWFEQMMLGRGCENCGEDHPAVLDFHHEEGKEFTISSAVGDGLSIRRIEEEIKKCTILCSNCHRKHHYNERFTARVLVWDERALSTP